MTNRMPCSKSTSSPFAVLIGGFKRYSVWLANRMPRSKITSSSSPFAVLIGGFKRCSIWRANGMPHSKIPQAVFWLEGSNRPASGLANGMHGVLRSVAWDGDLPPRGMNSRSPLSPPPGWCPWKKNGVLTHDVYVENSVVDPDQDSRGSVDPDSQSGSGLGSKRAKITHKIEGS